MKILIFGGGAVGLGIASCLLKSGENIDIFDREETIKLLKSKGLKRKGLFGDYQADSIQFNAYYKIQELENNIYDLILACTKSSDSRTAAESLSELINTDTGKTKIVLFQNGWGNAKIFTEFFPETMIYNARVITGFNKPALNEVEITVHAQPIHIGSLYNNGPGNLLDLCDSINRGGIPCEWTGEIEKDLWAKMLYNCILNPLGAIFNVPYGELGRSEYSRSIMKKISEEIFCVIEKAGYETHWKSSDEYLETFYDKLLPPTAKHEASMLQDFKKKRRTEIDAMNGAAVRLGDELNIDVSTNRTILNIIKFLESQL